MYYWWYSRSKGSLSSIGLLLCSCNFVSNILFCVLFSLSLYSFSIHEVKKGFARVCGALPGSCYFQWKNCTEKSGQRDRENWYALFNWKLNITFYFLSIQNPLRIFKTIANPRRIVLTTTICFRRLRLKKMMVQFPIEQRVFSAYRFSRSRYPDFSVQFFHRE